MNLCSAGSIFLLLAAACYAAPTAAEAPYPNRTINVLVGIPPGGAPDIVARHRSDSR
jgi:tripartite-type tricarboxylate transporter receptor subunit TctC